MDINQNLEQINTFEKGMNTDVSDTLLPNNQYRYAENLRFTSHDTDNTGELQPIKDMRLLHRMFDSQGREEQIIATSQIRDYAILITRSELGWSIWKLLNDETHLDPIRVFGPCTADLGDNISIVTRWENENDVKVYIADGVNQLMAINIMHKDGYDNSAPKDIKYLTSYNELKLTQPLISETNVSGNLKPAIIQYTYILYKEGGASTKYAPLSEPYYLLKDNGEGYLPNESTNTALHISIGVEGNLQGLNKIQVYRITYSQYGQDPEIYTIYDDDFDGVLQYTDAGVNIESFSKSEFLKSETYDKIKPATIESKGNYLFAGNIEDLQDEIDQQWDGIDFKDENYVKIEQVYGNYILDYDGSLHSEHDTYKPSLRPGESYRYGIVLYDDSGRRSSVKFIKDILVDSSNNLFQINQADSGKYNVTPIGIKVTLQNIPHCSGYEVVRCLRGVNESRILYQGIVGLPVGHETEISTPSFLSRNIIYPCAENVKTNTNVAIFACPECVYLPTETSSIIDSVEMQIQGVCDYDVPVQNITVDAFNYADSIGDYFLNDDDEMSIDDDVVDNEYATVIKTDSAFGAQAIYSVCVHSSIGKSIDAENQEKKAIFRVIVPGTIGENRNYRYSKDSVQNNESGELIQDPFFADIDLTGPVLHDDADENIKFLCPFAYTDTLYNRHIMTYSSYIDPIVDDNHNIKSTDYNSSIQSAKVIDSYHPSDQVIYENKLTGIDQYKYLIGTYTYCNFAKETRLIDWTGGFEYGTDPDEQSGGWCQTYAGGKALLLNLKNPLATNKDTRSIIDYTGFDRTSAYSKVSMRVNDLYDLCNISVANIINTSYAGYGPINNSEFCSFGNYYPYVSGESHDIFDGDTYINVFKYNHTHTIQQSDRWQVGASIVYMVPIQSSIDLLKSSGDLYPNLEGQRQYFLQDYAGNMFKLYQQERDAYIYNAAYSQEMNLMSYHPVMRTEVHSGKFDTRIKVSEEKANGEKFDSWLNFSVTGTLDADTRFGEITHMRLFKDALIFWQKEATGIVSVNERVIVQDMNDTNLLLGTGGVLQRFDYLSTKYGMQKPYIAETQSDTTLYFWDAYKKEILAYAGGQQVQPMTEIKTIRNYIINNPLNQKPLFVYDSDHNEVLMSAVNRAPIVYNETAKQFISVYTDYSAENSVYFNDRIWLTFNNNISRINAGDYVEAKLQYTVNKNSTMVKVFDNVRMGINQVSNNYFIQTPFELPVEQDVNQLQFRFKSPQQYSETQVAITDREYDYRFAIPRAQIKDGGAWNDPKYGQRMRGKYLITDLTIPEHPNTTKNAFSLQYITTKFRISYS